MEIDPKTLSFLPVGPGNRLIKTGSKSYQRKGRDDDNDYYDEINEEGTVVAKYHVWHHMNIYPPQKVDKGWKKFDVNGEVVDWGGK